jgi:hypothetical protein
VQWPIRTFTDRVPGFEASVFYRIVAVVESGLESAASPAARAELPTGPVVQGELLAAAAHPSRPLFYVAHQQQLPSTYQWVNRLSVLDEEASSVSASTTLPHGVVQMYADEHNGTARVHILGGDNTLQTYDSSLNLLHTLSVGDASSGSFAVVGGVAVFSAYTSSGVGLRTYSLSTGEVLDTHRIGESYSLHARPSHGEVIGLENSFYSGKRVRFTVDSDGQMGPLVEFGGNIDYADAQVSLSTDERMLAIGIGPIHLFDLGGTSPTHLRSVSSSFTFNAHTVAPDGTLYAAEDNYRHLVVVDPSGKRSTWATGNYGANLALRGGELFVLAQTDYYSSTAKIGIEVHSLTD